MTKLKCGGFIVGLRLNHTISDAPGLCQFMIAIAEIAQGMQSPSILPVWERHILSARTTPHVTCDHHVYDAVSDLNGTNTILMNEWYTSHSFLVSTKNRTIHKVVSIYSIYKYKF